MSTLKNVKVSQRYGYFLCPCVLSMDLIDEIRSLDPRMKFYDYSDIELRRTGVKYLDELSEMDKKDVCGSYIMIGLTEEEASPDGLDAFYTKLDPIDLFEAVKEFFGPSMDPSYKTLLREREKIEDELEFKLQMRKAS